MVVVGTGGLVVGTATDRATTSAVGAGTGGAVVGVGGAVVGGVVVEVAAAADAAWVSEASRQAGTPAPPAADPPVAAPVEGAAVAWCGPAPPGGGADAPESFWSSRSGTTSRAPQRRNAAPCRLLVSMVGLRTPLSLSDCAVPLPPAGGRLRGNAGPNRGTVRISSSSRSSQCVRQPH